MLLNGFAIYNLNFAAAYALDDYRGVANYLKSDAARGRPVLFLLGDMDLLRSYYHVDNVLDARHVEPEALDAAFTRLAGDAPEIIVAINREYYWVNWSGKTFADIYPGDRYAVGRHVHFPYFDLYFLTRK